MKSTTRLVFRGHGFKSYFHIHLPSCNFTIIHLSTCFPFQPNVVKEFELNANAHLRDQHKTEAAISPWRSNDETVTKPVTAATAEPKPSLENTFQKSLSPQGVSNCEQDINKTNFKQSSNDSKLFTHSIKGDLSHAKHPGDGREPCTVHNTQNLQNSLKNVLITVNTSPKTGTVEQLTQSSDNDDDELEFLLSLETPGVKDNSKLPDGNQTNKVSQRKRCTHRTG